MFHWGSDTDNGLPLWGHPFLSSQTLVPHTGPSWLPTPLPTTIDTWLALPHLTDLGLNCLGRERKERKWKTKRNRNKSDHISKCGLYSPYNKKLFFRWRNGLYLSGLSNRNTKPIGYRYGYINTGMRFIIETGSCGVEAEKSYHQPSTW